MKKIGFIGLGAMGKPMALNLVKAKYDVCVFDVVKPAVDELVSSGAEAFDTVSNLAKEVDVVITMLPNSKIVESVLTEFLSSSKEGQIIIDMSTVTTSSTVSMANKALEKGLKYVDAPVSGGFKGAEKGSLTIMIGGEDEVVKDVMPILEVMGEKIYHLGGTGTGNSMKLVNNLLLGCNMTAIAEALSLGTKLGIDLDKMYNVITQSSGKSYALDAKVPGFIKERNFKPGFAIDLQYKDLELAIETAKNEKIPLPMTSLSQQIFEMARSQNLGREDISAVIKVWENMLGIEIGN